MECIFCEIVAGRAPAALIYEDEDTLAFMTIAPIHRGHALVVPKKHAADVFEILPEDAAAVMRTALKVARAMSVTIQPDGVNLFQTNGSAAGQTVFHFHVHVVPRWKADHSVALVRSYFPEEGDLNQTADQIRQAMASGGFTFT